jgi:hypothetical protein
VADDEPDDIRPRASYYEDEADAPRTVPRVIEEVIP